MASKGYLPERHALFIMSKKVCTKCKVEKDLSEFGNRKASKDGLMYKCKECNRIKSNKYSKENKEKRSITAKLRYKRDKDKILKKSKEYYEDNKEKVLKRHKKWRDRNPDYHSDYWSDNIEHNKKMQRKYYKNNKDYVLERNRKWKKNNKQKYRDSYNNWNAKKKKEDPLHLLKLRIRDTITKSFKKRNWGKTSLTADILGRTWLEFKNYLEDNPYGFTIKDEELDLDHIVPLSTAATKEDVINLHYYTNFQLLPSYYNRYIKKDNKWDEEDFKNWLKENPL